MIDLNELRDIYGFGSEYYLELVEARVEDGVSNMDACTLGDYLDEVILNGLEKFRGLGPDAPDGIDLEEWFTYLDDMISLSQAIVYNNKKLCELTIDEMFDSDAVSEIEAENAAYRHELLDMLQDSWELLYV